MSLHLLACNSPLAVRSMYWSMARVLGTPVLQHITGSISSLGLIKKLSKAGQKDNLVEMIA